MGQLLEAVPGEAKRVVNVKACSRVMNSCNNLSQRCYAAGAPIPLPTAAPMRAAAPLPADPPPPAMAQPEGLTETSEQDLAEQRVQAAQMRYAAALERLSDLSTAEAALNRAVRITVASLKLIPAP